MQVKKAIILAGGLGTRFLPLSKAVEKPLLPVGDKPMIQYILEEVRDSGIKEVIIVSPKESRIKAYFERDEKLEKALQKRGREEYLTKLAQITKLTEELSLTYVLQEEPLGNGHSLLQAKKKIGNESFALLFCDDIFESKPTALKQLLDMFNTSQRPIIGLMQANKDDISAFGVIDPEKIAKGVFKVKSIIEKPAKDEAPSNLAVVGRYILTPEIFEFLESRVGSKEKELYLTYAIADALKAGKTFYGLLLKGKWLRCGNIHDWLCSSFSISIRNPYIKKELTKILK